MKRASLARNRTMETLSLDRLIDSARREALIEGVERSGDEVVLIQGSNRFQLPQRHAVLFLVGMLRGRSWYVGDEEEEPAAEQESPRAAVLSEPGVGPAPAVPAAPAEGRAGGEKVAWRRLASMGGVETTLDALLAFTRESGIIEHFEKDRRRGVVRIQIPACTSWMSYAEAVSYLFDCVQDQVRVQQETPPART